jgi:hypothetical protein
MCDPILNEAFDAINHAHGGHAFSGSESTLMDPLNASMNPLSSMVNREQKIDIAELKDMMGQMLAALQRSQESPPHIDLGSKETHLRDLSTQFDPRMDQEIHLYTGRGDERTIIV